MSGWGALGSSPWGIVEAWGFTMVQALRPVLEELHRIDRMEDADNIKMTCHMIEGRPRWWVTCLVRRP